MLHQGQGLIDANNEQVAAGVVDRYILARLEVAELANALGGDARGGEVGDAAGLEFDADVGDVDLGRKDGQADGAHFPHGRVGEGEHDVEVMNHEIEDDIDIERTRSENGEAMRLKEHRTTQAGFCGEDGGVEALQMARLQNLFLLFGESDQVVGFGQCCRKRLFDEQVDMSIEQCRGDAVVVHCGHGNGGRIDLNIGLKQIIERRKDGDAILRVRFRGACGVGLKRGDKLDACSGQFELAVDAKVIAAEGSTAGNRNAQFSLACDATLPCLRRP